MMGVGRKGSGRESPWPLPTQNVGLRSSKPLGSFCLLIVSLVSDIFLLHGLFLARIRDIILDADVAVCRSTENHRR